MADGGKALKLYEKGKFEKLQVYILKSLEKDSLSPGVKYVHSLLLLDTGFTGFDINGSYLKILDAKISFLLIDEKSQVKLAKAGITDSALIMQKIRIEEMAFRRSRDLHTIDAYDFFIDFFSTSAMVDSAIIFRDEIAYANALEQNTFQGFQLFIKTYPNALQVAEAKKNYDRLIFKSKTGEGKLDNFINFLNENPQSPYRMNAEFEILALSSADNLAESYRWFIDQYPNSDLRKLAEGFLYHHLLLSHSPQEIMDAYPMLGGSDSLQNIARLSAKTIFPVYEQGRYSFIDSEGTKITTHSYDSISSALVCGNMMEDFITVYSRDSLFIAALDGHVFYKGIGYEEVSSLGGGIIAIKNGNKIKLVHKSGFLFPDIFPEQVQLLHHSFLKIKKEGLWGLVTLMGKEALPPEYDDIDAEGGFIMVKKGNHVAITNVQQLKKVVQGNEVPLFFSFDDYFLLDNDHLVAISGDREALLDKELNPVLKLEKHKIDHFYGGWTRKSENGYQIYDENYHLLSGENYTRILKDNKKIAFQLNGLWGISFAGQAFSQDLYFDSVYFLHDDITLLFNHANTYVRFKLDSLIKLEEYEKLSLLKPQSVLPTMEKLPGYVLIENKKGILSVLNEEGKEIIKGRFDKIEALGREYLVVTKNNKKGLYRNDGKMLLKTSYDGISNYDQGYVSTLLNNKFGMYHYKNERLLSAKHSKTLKPYGKLFFISESNNLLAFVNMENDFITEYQFGKTKYWNDTIALVKTDGHWQLYDIRNKTIAYDGIELYEDIQTNSDERLLLITKNNQNGVISSKLGEIIGPTFNDIYNVGTANEPVFFAEKYIKEADFYIAIYYDKTGRIIRKQVFSDEEYWKIYCGE